MNDGVENDQADPGIADASEPGDGASVEAVLFAAHPGATGDPRVDDAISRLGELDSLPTPEHVEVVEDVQRRLQAALGDAAG